MYEKQPQDKDTEGSDHIKNVLLDTGTEPACLHLIDVGMRSLENPSNVADEVK
ncbi:MAG: hypothetical protein H6Q69_3680 [Firmicutes bacterium]|nr:hypothetical protein [Bacillota bacterium]